MASEPTADPRAAARGSAPVPNPSALADALQQLSTLLLLTAEAADTIAAMLTGQPVSTAADMYPDSQPDTRADDERPRLSVVRPLPTDTTEDSQ